MIRDIFVPRKIKKQYSRKPMSTNKFIKEFEDCFEIKVDKDIAAAFKQLYKDSYRTTKQLVHVFGVRNSGRTTLCNMILIYDAVRNSCLHYPGGQFPLWIISDTVKNYSSDILNKNIHNFLSSCCVDVKTVTSYHKNELFGERSGSYLDDLSSAGSDVKTLTFDKFLRAIESEGDFISHYVIVYDAPPVSETFCETDHLRMKIYLKNRAKTI